MNGQVEALSKKIHLPPTDQSAVRCPQSERPNGADAVSEVDDAEQASHLDHAFARAEQRAHIGGDFLDQIARYMRLGHRQHGVTAARLECGLDSVAAHIEGYAAIEPARKLSRLGAGQSRKLAGIDPGERCPHHQMAAHDRVLRPAGYVKRTAGDGELQLLETHRSGGETTPEFHIGEAQRAICEQLGGDMGGDVRAALRLGTKRQSAPIAGLRAAGLGCSRERRG